MEVYLMPEYFFLYNLLFMLVFFIIAGAISALSFRIYALTRKRQLRLFGLSFLAFALAHAAMVGAELFRINLFNNGLRLMGHAAGEVIEFWPLLMGLTFTLYLVGLVLLVYMTFKTEDKRLLFLLGALLGASMIFVPRPVFLFHTFSVIILFFLMVFYAKSYWKHRHTGNLLVFLAFFFLLLGNLTLIFSINMMPFFTIGRVLQLVGYGCFLANLILVFKK